MWIEDFRVIRPKKTLYCICPMCSKKFVSKTILDSGRGLTPNRRFRMYCVVCVKKIQVNKLTARAL